MQFHGPGIRWREREGQWWTHRGSSGLPSAPAWVLAWPAEESFCRRLSYGDLWTEERNQEGCSPRSTRRSAFSGHQAVQGGSFCGRKGCQVRPCSGLWSGLKSHAQAGPTLFSSEPRCQMRTPSSKNAPPVQPRMSSCLAASVFCKLTRPTMSTSSPDRRGASPCPLQAVDNSLPPTVRAEKFGGHL